MSPTRIARYLLFVSLTLGLVSVAGEVNPAYTLITLGALVAGMIAEEKGRYHLPNPLATGGAIALILLNIATMNMNSFFNHVMAILFILISAKLLTPKKVRDYLQLFLLSLLLIAGAAVVRWGMEFGLLLTANIFLLISGLVFLFTSTEKETISSREVQSLFLWSSLISLALLPSTMFFFLILPRPSIAFTPGWGGGKVARSGFGENITPGKVESIKKDSSVAMRVEWLKGTRPAPQDLYWRGKVYMEYRRGRWISGSFSKRPSLPPLPPGRDTTYKVFLEPQESDVLFALGLPTGVSLSRGRALLSPGFTLRSSSPVTSRLSYTLRSRMVKAFPPLVPPPRFLQVPDPVARQLRALARSIAPGEKDPLRLARAVEEYLRRNHRYSLHPRNGGPYPVVSFLLHGGAGHCEYFATAMVLLMRLRKVPARIVAGFQGGEWNRLGNYYMVRNSNAHTWVEVYKKGTGWVPFDPTPPSPLEEGGRTPSWGPLARLVDYLKFQWYHWVISYDVERQAQLVKRALKVFSSSTTVPILSPSSPLRKTVLVLMGIVAGLFLGLRLLSRHRKRPRTWGERLARILTEGGFPLQPGETLLELAHRIEKDHPLLGKKTREAVELYYRKEYGGQDITPTALETLLGEIQDLVKRGEEKDEPS